MKQISTLTPAGFQAIIDQNKNDEQTKINALCQNITENYSTMVDLGKEMRENQDNLKEKQEAESHI